MKLINYKETHFNLIIEKDHPLCPEKDTTKETPIEKCKHCQETFTEPHKINEHIRKCQKGNVKWSKVVSNVEVMDTLTKKVRHLESDLKDSEEKGRGPLLVNTKQSMQQEK